MSLTLKGISSGGFAGYELTDQLLYNVKAWLDWGFLHHGGYNLYLNGQDTFLSDNESNLHVVQDGRWPLNSVWEGVGREWVWESGVSVASGDITPFRVSGVYVDGEFVPVDSVGPQRYHVDYLHGRLLFEELQNPNSIISANYVSRAIFVGFSDSKVCQNLMLEAVEEFLSKTVPSGTASRDEQIWLPSVFVEVQSGKGTGLMLGGGQIKTRTIVLHIFADSANDRNLIMDWLDYNNRSAFTMFDLNKIQFPLDEFGSPIPGATNWVDLMSSYPWRKLRITEGSCKTINSLNSKLFRGQVRWSVEVDLGGI